MRRCTGHALLIQGNQFNEITSHLDLAQTPIPYMWIWASVSKIVSRFSVYCHPVLVLSLQSDSTSLYGNDSTFALLFRCFYQSSFSLYPIAAFRIATYILVSLPPLLEVMIPFSPRWIMTSSILDFPLTHISFLECRPFLRNAYYYLLWYIRAAIKKSWGLWKWSV